MHTRDQRYATSVYEKVQTVKSAFPDDYKKYGALSHKLPILIHTAGLAQALAYVETRKGPIYKQFLKDLSETVDMGTPLSEKARTAELSYYMHLTQQVLAALLWYKRFAQSMLNVDATESVEQESA